MSHRFALRAPLLVLALSSSAWAASDNLLKNGSLDLAAGTPSASSSGIAYVGAYNSTALAGPDGGWTITAGTVDVVPTSYWDAPTGMGYSVDMIGTPGMAAAGTDQLTPAVQASRQSQLGQIVQLVGTEAEETYQLAFSMSVNPLTGPLREYLTIKRLLVEAVAVGEEGEKVLEWREYDLARGTRHPENMQWLTDVQADAHHDPFTFTAEGDTLIRFTALLPRYAPAGATQDNIYCGPAIGNISLVSLGGGEPVPEPTSLGLLGVGVSALLFKRRRGR